MAIHRSQHPRQIQNPPIVNQRRSYELNDRYTADNATQIRRQIKDAMLSCIDTAGLRRAFLEIPKTFTLAHSNFYTGANDARVNIFCHRFDEQYKLLTLIRFNWNGQPVTVEDVMDYRDVEVAHFQTDRQGLLQHATIANLSQNNNPVLFDSTLYCVAAHTNNPGPHKLSILTQAELQSQTVSARDIFYDTAVMCERFGCSRLDLSTNTQSTLWDAAVSSIASSIIIGSGTVLRSELDWCLPRILGEPQSPTP